MTPQSRETICQQLSAKKHCLGLPLESVRRIDGYLREFWGITTPMPPGEWEERLRELAGDSLAEKYWDLHDQLASCLESDLPIPRGLERKFYDVIANMKISGHVHSKKRTEILDAGCLLVHLIHELGVTGPVLDVGCHTGYHAHLLALETNLSVCGIDQSSEAIDIASKHDPKNNLSFFNNDLDSLRPDNLFELVYAIHSVAMNKHVMKKIGAVLQPGGVFAMFERTVPDESQKARRAVRDAGFGFGLADVVGGWLGEDRGYGASPVLVLVRGGSTLIPADLFEQSQSSWGHFREYANSPGTPWEEKTQAYCRGHLLNAKASDCE